MFIRASSELCELEKGERVYINLDNVIEMQNIDGRYAMLIMTNGYEYYITHNEYKKILTKLV